MVDLRDNLICVIPARGGSEGIPHKNLRKIGGIPLVSHSVRHALKAGIDPSRIIVSSDSEMILEVAQADGVVPLLRPESISTSCASTESALIHAVEKYPAENILLLQPTSPIRFLKTIDKFIDFFEWSKFDSALSCTKLYNFTWQIMQGKDDEQSPVWISNYDRRRRPRRQDLKEHQYLYFDNGNMYLMKTEFLIKSNSRLSGNIGVFTTTELEGMQLDSFEELHIFESIFDGTIARLCGVAEACCIERVA